MVDKIEQKCYDAESFGWVDVSFELREFKNGVNGGARRMKYYELGVVARWIVNGKVTMQDVEQAVQEERVRQALKGVEKSTKEKEKERSVQNVLKFKTELWSAVAKYELDFDNLVSLLLKDRFIGPAMESDRKFELGTIQDLGDGPCLKIRVQSVGVRYLVLVSYRDATGKTRYSPRISSKPTRPNPKQFGSGTRGPDGRELEGDQFGTSWERRE